MNILLSVETLLIGGAEKFVVGLANHFVAKDAVYLYIVHPDKVDETLKTEISSEVKILIPNRILYRIAKNIDRLIFKLGLRGSVLNQLTVKSSSRVVKKHKIAIIHSHQFNVDYAFACLNQTLKTPIPHVATIHGDYLNFFYRHKAGEKIYGNKYFPEKFRFVLSSLNKMVVISDKQKDFFESRKADGLNIPDLVKIYNGIKRPKYISSKVKSGNFVFGMVARGIPEKGWTYAIEAFKNLNRVNTQLVLVGDSDYLRKLKESNSDPRIQFAGHVYNTFDCISQFDVGIMPSYYASESLPTSVIEYLALKKPVIATELGEVKNMLCLREGDAGIVIPFDEGTIVNHLVQAMIKLMDDNAFYDTCSGNAAMAFERFSIEECVSNYRKLYSRLIDRKE